MINSLVFLRTFLPKKVNFAFSQESLTEDDFFGENIVKNLAAFLGIPKEKIRVMEVVSAANGKRRRRALGSGLTEITVRKQVLYDSNQIFLCFVIGLRIEILVIVTVL